MKKNKTKIVIEITMYTSVKLSRHVVFRITIEFKFKNSDHKVLSNTIPTKKIPKILFVNPDLVI